MAIDESKRKSLFGEWGIYQTYSMREKKRKEEEQLEPFLRPIRTLKIVAYLALFVAVALIGRTYPHERFGPNVSRAELNASTAADQNRDYIKIGGIVVIAIAASVSERMLRRRLVARFAETPENTQTISS